MSLIVFNRSEMMQIAALADAMLGGQVADAQKRKGEAEIEFAIAEQQSIVAQQQLDIAQQRLAMLLGMPMF